MSETFCEDRILTVLKSCVGSSKRPQHPRGLGNRRSLLNRLRVSLEAIKRRLCQKFNKSNYSTLFASYILILSGPYLTLSLLFLRYLPGGDLLRYCNNTGLPLPELSVNIITRQLMRALVYMHMNNVVHADVKLENTLFGSDDLESLHLVDFGLSMNIRNLTEIPEG